MASFPSLSIYAPRVQPPTAIQQAVVSYFARMRFFDNIRDRGKESNKKLGVLALTNGHEALLKSLARDGKLNKVDLSKVYDAQRKKQVQGNWSAIDVDDIEEVINQEKRKRQRRKERHL